MFWFAVVFVSLLVVGLTILLLFRYYIYHNGDCIATQLMRYFQKFEDDDGKLYDAFVSYRGHPDDEQFVVHKLRVELEVKRNFKLCLHFRDFMIGNTIADNILDAVQQSRRTILLISPAYLEGEWPRLEYQAAQHEMLKCKARIIPIIYKDISAQRRGMDRTLKHILDSITYMEWPGCDPENTKAEARFWRRLELSMPKKKAQETVSTTLPIQCRHI